MASLGLAQRIRIGLDGNSATEFPRMGRLSFGRTRVGFRVMASGGQSVEPDLSVTVNGLKMPNPFVIGSGPPGTNYTVMKRAFDEGWGGVIAKTNDMNSYICSVRYSETGDHRVLDQYVWSNLKKFLNPAIAGQREE